ncbi:OapA N-terminal domain-containing protein [Budvicia aquatica]|uniref:Opacity-associated protein A N-terminal motif n=1 Tax=Budvicia aquatica TaxID=82979 RepID=A0A484ZF18_9GAMM|nr:OapA N-terminal domain-containing protein [Budvicia aquatica]VFS47072.1 Opacity-associated protein A N-terminal motif [Budvicia aquatica]
MQANKGRKKAFTGSNPLKAGLSKLWHLSDSFDWMSPLPYPHRRGVILATLLLLGAFFWPSSTPEDQTNNSPATPVDISASATQNQPQTPPSTPEVSEPHSAPAQAEPVATQPQQSAETPHRFSQSHNNSRQNLRQLRHHRRQITGSGKSSLFSVATR